MKKNYLTLAHKIINKWITRIYLKKYYQTRLNLLIIVR